MVHKKWKAKRKLQPVSVRFVVPNMEPGRIHSPTLGEELTPMLDGAYTMQMMQFVTRTGFDDLPEEVIYKTKWAILDALGNMLGAYGTDHHVVRSVLAVAQEIGGRGESTIVGSGLKTSSPNAAFANGVLANFLDLSDGHNCTLGHINDHMIPIAFAIGEREFVNGKDLITSIALGYEVYIRLSAALHADALGEFKSPIALALGVIAGVVSAGKLLRLDSDQIASAIALASSIPMCCYQYQLSGGSEKDIAHSGIGCWRAVLSALLAQKGVRGSTEILEGERGFFQALTHEYYLERLTEGLGNDYRMTECYTKPYPACRFTHASIDATLQVLKEHEFDINDISRIIVKTNNRSARISNIIIDSHIDAIFSHQYQVAVCAVEGKPDLPTLWCEKLEEPSIQKVISKIDLVVDPQLDEFYRTSGKPGDKWACRVDFIMKDGECYSATVFRPKGDVSNPMTWHELEERTRQLSKTTFSEKQTDEIIERIRDLDKLKDISELTELFAH